MLSESSKFKIRDAKGEIASLGVLVNDEARRSLHHHHRGEPPWGPLAPLVAPAGSTGKDYSVNAPEMPLIGSFQFGGGSTYAMWQLLTTIEPNFDAMERRICNYSQTIVVVVTDDGTADGGSTPREASVYLLYPPTSSSPNNSQYVSERFKGRIRVFSSDPSAWVTISEA